MFFVHLHKIIPLELLQIFGLFHQSVLSLRENLWQKVSLIKCNMYNIPPKFFLECPIVPSSWVPLVRYQRCAGNSQEYPTSNPDRPDRKRSRKTNWQSNEEPETINPSVKYLLVTLEKCIHHSNEHDDRPERHLALAHHLGVHDGGAGGVEHPEWDDPGYAEILVTH